jgi:hypothetical protein
MTTNIIIRPTYDSYLEERLGKDCCITLIYGLAVTLQQFERLIIKHKMDYNPVVSYLLQQKYRGLISFGYKYDSLIVGVLVTKHIVPFSYAMSLKRPSMENINYSRNLQASFARLCRHLGVEMKLEVHALITQLI